MDVFLERLDRWRAAGKILHVRHSKVSIIETNKRTRNKLFVRVSRYFDYGHRFVTGTTRTGSASDSALSNGVANCPTTSGVVRLVISGVAVRCGSGGGQIVIVGIAVGSVGDLSGRCVLTFTGCIEGFLKAENCI